MSNTEERNQYRKRAVISFVGALALAITKGLSNTWWSAIIVGVLVIFGGLSLLRSLEEQDKVMGLVIAAGGLLLIISRIPILGTIASIILGITGFALIAFGVYNLVMYFSKTTDNK